MKDNSLTVAVGSINPVKVNAALEAFSLVMKLPIKTISIDVASGVSDQPMTYKETRLGAKNRVQKLLVEQQADYYIAYEGGVDIFDDGPKTFVVLCISNGEDWVFGQSATLPLPLSIYHQLLQGIELGSAMDALFNTQNIKQKGGAIGQLTHGLETRLSIYRSATILALSRFANKALYV